MSVTRGWLGVALLVTAAGSTGRAQTPAALTSPLPASPQPPIVTAEALPIPGQVLSTLPFESRQAAPVVSGGPAPSIGPDGNPAPLTTQNNLLGPRPSTTQAWLDYEIPGCCGPVGRNGPIGYDLYFRFGSSVPIGGGTLNRNLNAGYMFMFGGRSLLFNPDGDRAWVIDLGVFYDYHDAGGQQQIPYINTSATLRDYLRAGASLGFGRDWYLNAPGFVTGTTSFTRDWGADAGIRFASNHAGLNVNSTAVPYARRQDNLGSTYVALHTDWIIPQGGWDLVLGGRMEAEYSWTSVLRTVKSELTTLNFMLQAGIRY